jgi:branched-chain amino acid transport system ATP-binding protein
MSDNHEFSLHGLCAGYGRMQVVSDVSLSVRSGETVAIVGRNGAGKTTTVRAAVGIRSGVFAGSVVLDDQDVTRLSPSELLSRGVVLVPEGHRVFKDLTVEDNLRVGAFLNRRGGRKLIDQRRDSVWRLFPILEEFAQRPAGQLSGGQQQMVSIGQALMSGPRFVILDEPSSGLAPAVVLDIYRALERLAADGVGIVVVEQNVDRGLERSDRCYVLDGGHVRREGRSDILAADADVVAIVTGIRRPGTTSIPG